MRCDRTLRFVLPLAGFLLAGCAALHPPETLPPPAAPAPARAAVTPPAAPAEDRLPPTSAIAELPDPQHGGQEAQAGAPAGSAPSPDGEISAPAPSVLSRAAAPASGQAHEAAEPPVHHKAKVQQGGRGVASLCEEVGNKLGSVSVADCLAQKLQASGRSVNERALALRDFLPEGGATKARVLIMGGIHGDEYSSISILFKWMELLAREESAFSWRFLPLVNPDGLLDGKAVRQNANGVDLNRNFPSRDWRELALENWKVQTGRNPRRFPGSAPASEPEVRWVVEQILTWQPDVIVSVHAPYHLLDFDGPSKAPEKIGELYLHQLGVFPGSLGNYAGLDLGLPVVTLELPSAGIMPTQSQIAIMWQDLLKWLHGRAPDKSS